MCEQAGKEKDFGSQILDFQSLGGLQILHELLEKDMSIIKKCDLADEGNDKLYFPLDGFRKALEYHEKRFKIAIEIGDRAGEGQAYGNLGVAYDSLGDFRRPMPIAYHEKDLKIAIEIGDRAGEGGAYGNLGIANRSLGDFRKAIEYHEKELKTAIEIGDRAEKEEPMEILVMLSLYWMTSEKALIIMKKS